MTKSIIATYFKDRESAEKFVAKKNEDEKLREVGYTILEFKNGYLVAGKRQAELVGAE